MSLEAIEQNGVIPTEGTLERMGRKELLQKVLMDTLLAIEEETRIQGFDDVSNPLHPKKTVDLINANGVRYVVKAHPTGVFEKWPPTQQELEITEFYPEDSARTPANTEPIFAIEMRWDPFDSQRVLSTRSDLDFFPEHRVEFERPPGLEDSVIVLKTQYGKTIKLPFQSDVEGEMGRRLYSNFHLWSGETKPSGFPKPWQEVGIGQLDVSGVPQYLGENHMQAMLTTSLNVLTVLRPETNALPETT